MVKCNMCEKVFETEEDIPLLIEWEDGKVEQFIPGKMYKSGGEVFKGCPHCMTDGYLMDVEGSGNES